MTTAQQAIDLLNAGNVVEVSLDHDLGDDDLCGRGIDVVDWLAEQQETQSRVLWPRDGITLHTANPSGRDTMAMTIERYASRHLKVRRSTTGGGKPAFTFSRPDPAR